jgi:26S proteasome regulatory subunit T5
MSSAPPPNSDSNPNPGDSKPDAQMTTASTERKDEPQAIEAEAPEPEDTFEDIPEDIRNAPVEDINTRTRLIDNDIKVSSHAVS